MDTFTHDGWRVPHCYLKHLHIGKPEETQNVYRMLFLVIC